MCDRCMDFLFFLILILVRFDFFSRLISFLILWRFIGVFWFLMLGSGKCGVFGLK